MSIRGMTLVEIMQRDGSTSFNFQGSTAGTAIFDQGLKGFQGFTLFGLRSTIFSL